MITLIVDASSREERLAEDTVISILGKCDLQTPLPLETLEHYVLRSLEQQKDPPLSSRRVSKTVSCLRYALHVLFSHRYVTWERCHPEAIPVGYQLTVAGYNLYCNRHVQQV